MQHQSFSSFVHAGTFVFVSGQASVDPARQIVNDTFEGEMLPSMENLQAVFAGAGCLGALLKFDINVTAHARGG